MKLLERIRLHFKGLKKIETINYSEVKENQCEVILTNNYVEIVNLACCECYKKKLENMDYPAKLRYIGAKVTAGHESVIEHSNVVMMMRLNKSTMQNSVAEFLAENKYLDASINTQEGVLLLSGSILGYKQIIRHIRNFTNPIVQLILNEFYHFEKCFFLDFIKDGIMRERAFYDDIKMPPIRKLNHHNIDTLDIINYDDIDVLVGAAGQYFPKYELAKHISITVYFNNVSRIISQQITRHRNAISQKSQRYVDETNGTFNDPYKFKPDLYPNGIDIIVDGKKYTSQELGQYIASMYGKCIDAGLKKEDARGYLPNNIASSLYVTFKGKYLIHFCKMRADSHAQAEAQTFGYELQYHLPIIFKEVDLNKIYSYIDPYYNFIENTDGDYDDIDEVVSVETVTEPINK